MLVVNDSLRDYVQERLAGQVRNQHGVEVAGPVLALAGHGDDVTTELRRERLGHDANPFSEAAASQARSQPNRGQSPRLRDRERWSSFFEALIAPMSRDSSHRLPMSVTSPSSHLLVDHGPIEQVAPATGR
jgi:hypothetical protein